MTISIDDLKGAKFRILFMARLSKGGYIHAYSCTTYPRLAMSVTRQTRQAKETRVFTVDDKQIEGGLQAVADALNATGGTTQGETDGK